MSWNPWEAAEWFHKPLDEWPDAAKEFYRLLFIGQWRANAKKAKAQPPPTHTS